MREGWEQGDGEAPWQKMSTGEDKRGKQAHGDGPAPISVVLVNPPFASVDMPSLGLLQLQAATRRKLGASVSIRIVDLNLDFVSFMGGLAIYNHALSAEGQLTGFGDWFFRREAFPGAADNTREYFARFYFGSERADADFRDWIIDRRKNLGSFLDRLLRLYRIHRADVVGCTSLFAQTVAGIAICRRLKSYAGGPITVMGGSACEGEAARALTANGDAPDFVFSGPALVNFPEFLASLATGGNNQGTASSRPGVFVRNQGTNHKKPATGPALDPDTRLRLDYRPFLERRENRLGGQSGKPVLPFETSRGCSWGEKSPCRFCGLNGSCRDSRAMSPERARETIRQMFPLVDRCRLLAAVDNNMPADFPRLVFRDLNPPPGTVIRYEARPDLEAHELTCLRRGGVHCVQAGIEALHSHSLKLMRKGVTAPGNVRFLRDCAATGMRVEWNLLIGIPGEPAKVYRRYLELIPDLLHLPPPNGVFTVEFVRFSDYFNHAADYGLDLRPQDFYRLTFPWPDSAVKAMARRFVNDNADTGRLEQWQDKLNLACLRWREAWSVPERPPRLLIRGSEGKRRVEDSRRGKAAAIPLEEEAYRVLRRLDKPATFSRLAATMPEKTVDLETILAGLERRRLVFREGERLVSLALPD